MRGHPRAGAFKLQIVPPFFVRAPVVCSIVVFESSPACSTFAQKNGDGTQNADGCDHQPQQPAITAPSITVHLALAFLAGKVSATGAMAGAFLRGASSSSFTPSSKFLRRNSASICAISVLENSLSPPDGSSREQMSLTNSSSSFSEHRRKLPNIFSPFG